MTHFTANVMVEIRQDPGTQRISISKMRLDTEADNSFLDGLLELAEPWMLNVLEDHVSLDPGLLRGPVERSLKQVLSFPGIKIDTQLHDFNLTRLELGPQSGRAVVAAGASVDVSVTPGVLAASD